MLTPRRLRGPPGLDALRRTSRTPIRREASMKRWLVPVMVAVAALASATPAQAAHSSDKFLLIAEEDNFATAANGDSVAITVDEGSWFDGSPKAVSATGEFTHFDPNGNV